ncbi:hypothetical protein ZIOFF_013952 [Zingiber officinale]|uniref:hAT-like transposase RNase-H fold domain-containing protein n=1 Tax=Zingiber officinale TaxID=94328 RepID=A0A8J5I025_ZINOF|nr:hypothetical protein ZIOFF_013952 [Zingiber officinale]
MVIGCVKLGYDRRGKWMDLWKKSPVEEGKPDLMGNPSFNHQGFSLKRVSFGTEMIEVKIEIAADQKSQYNLAPTGSEYPTSNLVLQEVQKIKSALDTYAQHEDLFLKQLASKMKEKFDKYWGDCNLLMVIAAVLDPTKKMFAVEFCFPKLYSKLDASKHISKVKEIINSLYEEYVVEETNKGAPHPSESEGFGSSSVRRSQQSSVYSWDDFDDYCAKVETLEIKRSELVDYLEKGHLKKNEIPKIFSCLEWWRRNRM